MKTIVCLGDSLTNGARDEYYRNYPMELSSLIRARTGKHYVCLNHGVNGETTSQMLNRAPGLLAANRDASMVLFLGGTNDTKVPIPLDIYVDNVESIVLLARGHERPIVVGLLPPLFGTGLPCYSPAAGNEWIARYNDALRDLARRYDLQTCDFTTYGRELYSDGIHLNHAGYRRMAEDWFDVIATRL